MRLNIQQETYQLDKLQNRGKQMNSNYKEFLKLQ
jgi:hypothetical protein